MLFECINAVLAFVVLSTIKHVLCVSTAADWETQPRHFKTSRKLPKLELAVAQEKALLTLYLEHSFM